MHDDAQDWYGPDAATFGDRVAAAREQAGMTQSQLAKRMGIKLKTLKDWEQDLSEPRANRLSMMAGLLNVSIMWLLNGEGEGVSNPEEDSAITPEINDILVEIREMKATMKGQAEKLGRLEKKLRLKLQEETA